MTQPKWPEMDSSKQKLLKEYLIKSQKEASRFGPYSSITRENAYDSARDSIINCFVHYGDKSEEELRRLLYTSIRHRIISLLRKEKSRSRRMSSFVKIPPDEAFSSAKAMDEALILEEEIDSLNRALESLNEEDRYIIIMDNEGLPDKVIAEEMGKSLGCIKTRKRRAKGKVIEHMREYKTVPKPDIQ